MKNIKRTMFTLVVALAFLIVLVPSVLSTVRIIQPSSDANISSSIQIIVNVTGINASNVTFYYKTNSSYSLIGYNSTANLTQYSLFWNTSGREDYRYTIKVNVTKNSSIWQRNYSYRVYLDSRYPNFTSVNFSNTVGGRRIFSNGSYIRITATINESNDTISSVFANSTKITNSYLLWNSSIGKWVSLVRFIGNVTNNMLFLKSIDLSGKYVLKNYSFILDWSNPNIFIRSETKSIYNVPSAKGTKANPSGISNNKHVFNVSDDTNISSYYLYYDDNLINYSNTEQKYKFLNYTITPQPGKHNITLVVNDVLNKTTINRTTVYWWMISSSNSFISAWINKTKTTSSLYNVSIRKRSSLAYTNYIKLNVSQLYTCYYSETCGILFNSTKNISLEYLNIDKAKLSFFEFNWNKTPLLYFNNDTAVARSIISKINSNYTTNVKYLAMINDSYGKTKFIYNKSIFFGRVRFTGNFSDVNQFTDIFYFKNKDNLSDYTIIRNNDTCPSVSSPFNENSTRPCYLINLTKTILYVPRPSLVTVNKDNVSPKINISYPKSTFNNSVGLRIAFTTTEDSFCNVTIQKNAFKRNLTNLNLTGSSAFAKSFSYIFSSINFSNGNYNVTIGCADHYGNKNITKRSLSISDIVAPTITIVSPHTGTYSTTSSDTYNVSIDIDVNEYSDITYRIGSGSTISIGTNTLSATTSVVKPSGTYDLTIYALDTAGNLKTSQITFIVNAVISTSTTTTTTTTKTGIVIPQNQTAQTSKKDSEYWYKLLENVKTDMMIDNPFFDMTKISFTPIKNISSVKIELELLEKDFPVIQNNQSRRTYQYYSINSAINQTLISNPEIIFRIKKTWLMENNIEKVILTRFHDSWSDLPTTKLGEDSTYEIYKAVTPGFSYFVIVGVPPMPILEKPTVINNTIPKANDTKPKDSGDISVPVKKDKINFGLIMIIFIVLSGISLLGFYAYKTISIPVLKYVDLTPEEKERLRRYIAIKLTTGEPIHKIETELVNRGWSQNIVDNIIKTVELPKSKEKELEQFVEKMLRLKNIEKEDLKKALINAGWQLEVVDNILRKYK